MTDPTRLHRAQAAFYVAEAAMSAAHRELLSLAERDQELRDALVTAEQSLTALTSLILKRLRGHQ